MAKRVLQKVPYRRKPVEPAVGKFYSLEELYAPMQARKRIRKIRLDVRIAWVTALRGPKILRLVDCFLLNPHTGEIEKHYNLSAGLLYAELTPGEVKVIIDDGMKDISARMERFLNKKGEKQ